MGGMASLLAPPLFEPFGVDAVVKVGGSLLADVEVARRMASTLGELSADFSLVVFPGGGPTDNLVERIAREAGFQNGQIFHACMRAIDQTGVILSEMEPRLRCVSSLAGVRTALSDGAIPVLLPARLIDDLDIFNRTDILSSDSLGAFFAFLLGASSYIVLTDVDGIGPVGEHNFDPIASIDASELATWPETCVDVCLPLLTLSTCIETWVINGFEPERLGQLLRGDAVVGTQITAR